LLGAYTSFVVACRHNASAMAALVSFRPAWTRLLVEIAMGRRRAGPPSTAVTAVTDIAFHHLRFKATSLPHDAPTDVFLRDLLDLIALAMQTVAESLWWRESDEVDEIAAVFDPKVAHVASYTEQIAALLDTFVDRRDLPETLPEGILFASGDEA